MSFYENTDQFYLIARELFDRVQKENPAAAADLEEAKLLIRFKTVHPDGLIMINGRRHPASVTFGDNRIRPEVDVHMQTDTLHGILLGEIRLTEALSNKKMRVKGPMLKTLKVADLFHQCQQYYPQVLANHGLL